MDQNGKTRRKRNPREKAGIFKIITFLFTYDIFKNGVKRDLREEDIYEILKDYDAKGLGDLLEEEWQKERSRAKPAVFRLIWRPFGKLFLSYGLLHVAMKTVYILVSPMSMGKLVSYFSVGSTMPKSEAWFYAALTVTVNFCYFIWSHNYILLINQLGMRVRVAFCSLLYRKALNLSVTSLGEVTTGKIITLITKDVASFDSAIMYGNDIWIGVVQTSIIAYLMYQQIGISAIVGLTVFIIVIPLQFYFGKRISIYRIKSATKTDERLRTTQEASQFIKIIKMYTWKKYFSFLVGTYRKYEVHSLRKLYYIKALSLSLGTLSSKISFFVCVICYLYFENTITAEKAFVVLSCYHTLRSTLTIYIPLGIAQLAELGSALLRIHHVMMAAETVLEKPTQKIEEIAEGAPRVLLKKATVAVNGKKVLEGISLEMEKGLTTITGNVGSGKSALLGLILKDIKPAEGNVEVRGTISYACQEPWLFPATIRQNILFGQPYDKDRYGRVVRACCLKTDLDILPKGDDTIAGDRGLNLSKGQQARINLARAIYKDCDIYLLDDCLSALDAQVSRHVFEECVQNFLKDKICVLVTHQIRHLQQSDKIVVLNGGFLENTGGYKKLAQKQQNLMSDNVNCVTRTEEEEQVIKSDDYDTSETKKLLTLKEKRVYEEEKAEGAVNFSAYKKYFSYGGGFFTVMGLFVLFTIAQISTSYSDILVGKWVDIEGNLSDYKRRNLTGTAEYEEAKGRHEMTLNLYTTTVILATVFTLGRAFGYFIFSSRASVKLHKVTFENLMGATMKFFDEHLVGNILNRFSRDLAIIDENIPYIIFDAFRILLIIVGITYIICDANVFFLIPSGVLAIILYFVRRCYLPTSRSLKRLEGVTRSPVIGHLKASLEGLPTIRAHRAQSVLREEFDKHLNVFNSVYYMYMTTSRAFGFLMDLLCIVYITLITMTFMVIDKGVLAGKVGLALTQAFSLTGLLQVGIRQWAELENYMTYVERVLEFAAVEQERIGGRRPDNWPNEGRVEYRDVTLRYYDSDTPVLKSLNFVIEPLEKIGIVGRTGAGKSSIISTLFRLYEAEGSIIIDNENIKDIALDTLRSRISIIPQDPVLFSGTIRDNLDPFRKYSDEELWRVLDEVNLKEMVPSLELKISEGGTNFSTGQRQLICLARTIIQRNKILVLDEATANVDPQTDALIQRTIKEKFVECTVLTIAHRLDTVIKSDKVMVVDNGMVLEFGAPKTLLENERSRFYSMVNEAGLLSEVKLDS